MPPVQLSRLRRGTDCDEILPQVVSADRSKTSSLLALVDPNQAPWETLAPSVDRSSLRNIFGYILNAFVNLFQLLNTLPRWI